MHKRKWHRSRALGLCFSVVLVLLAGMVGAPRPAHAATQTTIAVIRSESAFAGFESTDATGCIVTSVFLVASTMIELTRPGTGGPQQVPGVGVDIGLFNVCTSTALLEAAGSSSVLTFQLAGDLSSATLTALGVVVHDALTDISFPVNINVTWAGTGSTTRQAETSHFRTPGMVMNAMEVGFTRAAQATGTITNGPTNYIPSPSTVGEVQNIRSGTITVALGEP